MKKFNYFTLLILIFSFLLGAMVFVKADVNSIRLGDVNGDRKITAADALEVLQYSVGKREKFSTEILHSTVCPVSHFTTYSFDGFYDWLKKGGDDENANQEFLKVFKLQKEILIAKAKKEELEEYDYEVIPNKPIYGFDWVIDEDNIENRQIFGFFIVMPNDNIKNKTLEELYFEYVTCSSHNGEAEIKYNKWNQTDYLYTDYQEDEDGNVISDSRAMFFVDDFLVSFSAAWTNMKKPFNPEYFDYFYYETVDIDIAE